MEPRKVLSKSLQGLLKNLESKPEAAFRQASYHGVAVSRTTNSLHLACETGIVEIPFDEIEDVKLPRTDRPDLATIIVRNPTAVREILRVNPLSNFGRDPFELFRRPFGRLVLGWTITGEDGFDTTTRSGSPPEPDQTDDYSPGPIPDDNDYRRL